MRVKSKLVLYQTVRDITNLFDAIKVHVHNSNIFNLSMLALVPPRKFGGTSVRHSQTHWHSLSEHPTKHQKNPSGCKSGKKHSCDWKQTEAFQSNLMPETFIYLWVPMIYDSLPLLVCRHVEWKSDDTFLRKSLFSECSLATPVSVELFWKVYYSRMCSWPLCVWFWHMYCSGSRLRHGFVTIWR